MKLIVISLSALLALPLLIIGAGEGSGASVADDALAGAFLEHPSIVLLAGAKRDVERGLVDPRVLRILLIAAERHSMVVGPLITGHSYYVAGTTRPSNHSFGRAADILAVDGQALSAANLGARDVVETLGTLPPELRPHELGSPWPVSFPGVSTFVRDHHDHLHAGYHR